jgi:PTH1 family peptidyl-tRNA hydrolase
MKLIVGLGNIGSEYEGTRHNVGFAVVDEVERRLERSSAWKAGKASYYFAKGVWKGEEVLLIKPTTYMNLSGRAVRDALQFYKVEVGDLVVATDDLAIPLGQLRLRLFGSDGGHNGLASVAYELGTDQWARLRVGIGSEFRKGEQVRYVLSRFKSDEQELMKESVIRAAEACIRIVEIGCERAMDRINTKPATSATKKPAENPNSAREEPRL